MFARRAARLLRRGPRPTLWRSFADKPPPPFPTVPTCPAPTCPCAATPALPDGLEIDRTTPLAGLMPGYAEQVLVCTGKDDWPSRIEDDNSGDNLAADLKELFKRGGTYSDVSLSRTRPTSRRRPVSVPCPCSA